MADAAVLAGADAVFDPGMDLVSRVYVGGIGALILNYFSKRPRANKILRTMTLPARSATAGSRTARDRVLDISWAYSF